MQPKWEAKEEVFSVVLLSFRSEFLRICLIECCSAYTSRGGRGGIAASTPMQFHRSSTVHYTSPAAASTRFSPQSHRCLHANAVFVLPRAFVTPLCDMLFPHSNTFCKVWQVSEKKSNRDGEFGWFGFGRRFSAAYLQSFIRATILCGIFAVFYPLCL